MHLEGLQNMLRVLVCPPPSAAADAVPTLLRHQVARVAVAVQMERLRGVRRVHPAIHAAAASLLRPSRSSNAAFSTAASAEPVPHPER